MNANIILDKIQVNDIDTFSPVKQNIIVVNGGGEKNFRVNANEIRMRKSNIFYSSTAVEKEDD